MPPAGRRQRASLKRPYGARHDGDTAPAARPLRPVAQIRGPPGPREREAPEFPCSGASNASRHSPAGSRARRHGVQAARPRRVRCMTLSPLIRVRLRHVYSTRRSREAAFEPTTTAASAFNIEDVPIHQCPQCGLRQYAQTSYVARVECVTCGFRLAPAKSSLPPWPWPGLSGRQRRLERNDVVSR
jgi:hypothetical protein